MFHRFPGFKRYHLVVQFDLDGFAFDDLQGDAFLLDGYADEAVAEVQAERILLPVLRNGRGEESPFSFRRMPAKP